MAGKCDLAVVNASKPALVHRLHELVGGSDL